jgi:hypothetical protein
VLGSDGETGGVKLFLMSSRFTFASPPPTS